jgi:CheY-like chemotaxis protein
MRPFAPLGESVPSNVVQFPTGPRGRVLIAHQVGTVRQVLRTIIEAQHIMVVEVADGEAALVELARARFDLLVLDLDLPERDGVIVMQMHRMMLAHQAIPVEPPAVIISLPSEVCGIATLTDHLLTLGVAGFINEPPRPSEIAPLIEATLQARTAKLSAGKHTAA